MEEARYSFNVKCLIQGFECCFTLREDQPGKAPELVDKANQIINYLVTKGAAPLKPVAGAKSAVSQAAAAQPGARQHSDLVSVPVCKKCGQSDMMELIQFNKDGQQREAYKCQRCDKWHR